MKKKTKQNLLLINIYKVKIYVQAYGVANVSMIIAHFLLYFKYLFNPFV
jgi:hypothetical protein